MGKAERLRRTGPSNSRPYHRVPPNANQDQPKTDQTTTDQTTTDLHKAYFLTGSDYRSAIFRYITQFFQILDSDDRGGLKDFFHPKASFGLLTDKKVARLKRYRFVLDKQTEKCFPIGPKNIVACLKMLPRTKHLKGDLLDNKISRTNEGASFGINGTFEMIGRGSTIPLSYVHRFFLVPDKDGRPLILHYRQHIKSDLDASGNKATDSAATPELPAPAVPQGNVINYQTVPKQDEGLLDDIVGLMTTCCSTTVAQQSAQGGLMSTSVSSAPASVGAHGATGGMTDPPNKEGLRDALIELTGMFDEQAEKCLQMNNWNWEQAVYDFKKLVAEDKLPRGCFFRVDGKAPCPPTKNIQVFQFAALTNLRVQWAEKCLQDLNWDWKKAKEAFDYMKAQGQIPAELFYSTDDTTDGLSPDEALVRRFSKGSGLKEDWARRCLEMANWHYLQAVRDFLFWKTFQEVPAEAFIP